MTLGLLVVSQKHCDPLHPILTGPSLSTAVQFPRSRMLSSQRSEGQSFSRCLINHLWALIFATARVLHVQYVHFGCDHCNPSDFILLCAFAFCIRNLPVVLILVPEFSNRVWINVLQSLRYFLNVFKFPFREDMVQQFGLDCSYWSRVKTDLQMGGGASSQDGSGNLGELLHGP